jgi:hypothetical protein
MRQVSVPSVASDNRDEEEDADLRRLNENLSRPLPIFWNGRAITGAWLARARALHHHPRCQRGSFSWQREQRKRARRDGGWLARFCGGEEGRCYLLVGCVRFRGWQAEQELLGRTATFPACGARLFLSCADAGVRLAGWPAKYKNMHALNWGARLARSSAARADKAIMSRAVQLCKAALRWPISWMERSTTAE